VAKRLFIGLLVLASTVLASAQSKPLIQGVWSVTEAVGGPGAATPTTVNTTPQPGFYIFTARHYSITRVTGETPRTAPKDANKPTVAELQEADRFVGQFGTYEIKGDSLTTHPGVARNPVIMAAAAPVTSSFKLEGNTLTLTTKNATTGISVVKLTRQELACFIEKMPTT
jgi:hypothetical protein